MDAGQAPGGAQPSRNVLPDRYVLGSPLGRGAFATSFLCEDRLRNRPVVIKLLDIAQAQAVDLFQREVRITESLSHPNIVKILDVGLTKDGRPYYVSEWVEGKDLGTILTASGPLGTKQSLQIASGIAEALAYVHSRGFLHRDLKPSNILIPGSPSTPDYKNPKILDFGVAGILSHAHGMTNAGMVFGTPRYMSPEQVLGQPHSPATDVYGWGLVFFEMLAGHPFRSRAGEVESLFRAILEEELTGDEFEGLPPDCATLIGNCVRRKPAERPSIDDVLQELRRLQAAPVSDVPVERFASGTVLLGSEADSTMASSPSMAPRAATVPASRKRIWPALLALACVASAISIVLILPAPLRRLPFLGGLLLIVASTAGAFWLRRWLGRESSAKEQAYALALGAKARVNLTETIALQLDDLVHRLRALDEQILAGSVALMLNEYSRSSDAKDRQSALMNVVALSEKLAHRLSPWYVRYKEVIASAVAVLGAVSGLLTTINSLRGPHHP